MCIKEFMRWRISSLGAFVVIRTGLLQFRVFKKASSALSEGFAVEVVTASYVALMTPALPN